MAIQGDPRECRIGLVGWLGMTTAIVAMARAPWIGLAVLEAAVVVLALATPASKSRALDVFAPWTCGDAPYVVVPYVDAADVQRTKAIELSAATPPLDRSIDPGISYVVPKVADPIAVAPPSFSTWHRGDLWLIGQVVDTTLSALRRAWVPPAA